jgi:hypothetical protein
MNTYSLPEDCCLDIENLGQIFNDTTNSYKINFFRSILVAIRDGQVAIDRKIYLSDISARMVSASWPIIEYYRLSLGSRDLLETLIKKISLNPQGINLASTAFEVYLERRVKQAISSLDLRELERYVPYRLLRPFFKSEIKGLPDWHVNEVIKGCAEASFNGERPSPYMISGGENGFIVVHELWYVYFLRNVKILLDWADWHLCRYLQRRNPNSPAIGSKLYLPKRRKSLKWQQNLWLPLFSKESVRCIYSNEVLSGDLIHLDHYLPWSFVCHDEPWNLIPVAPSANSSKSNSIPSSKYMASFVELQIRALAAAHSVLSGNEWQKVYFSYVAGLRVEALNFYWDDKIYQSYNETILPLAAIARRMGFNSDWEFRAAPP